MSERMQNETDRLLMCRAMELAERGKGHVNPNPLVGAVVVLDGEIIGEGWHASYGGWHAERNAFRNCKVSPRGATLYVTLEPCCHYGKTPPCTEAILENGIARVVIGLKDPNPLVGGKGIERLRKAGIEVVTGVEEEKLKEQNRIFLKYITNRIPWVVLKTAMTLDGKIAAAGGDSKWVTGEAARHRVQEMRSEYMGILVGAGTVKTDDPLLNCRLGEDRRQPVRIIADSKAAISPDSRIMQTARKYRTLIAHTEAAPAGYLKRIREGGAETCACRERGAKVDIPDLLSRLGAMGIDSVLLEGGGELNAAFIREGCVDEVFAFIAPKIIGGKEAKTPVEGSGFRKMEEAVKLKDIRVEQLGEDILIRGKVQKREQ